MDELNYESFASTQKQYEKGRKDINPRRSLAQQAYVKLTPKAAEWLEPIFEARLGSLGQIDEDFLKRLPQSGMDVAHWKPSSRH